MAKIKFNNISKSFGEFEAVKNFDLDVEDQEFICLVGPSGCGKTTTLRMLAGLETITKGSISINNNVINDVSPKDRDIAMVFRSYALYPHFTVYDNLAFGLRTREKIPLANLIISLASILFYGLIAGLWALLSYTLSITAMGETPLGNFNILFIAGLIGGFGMFSMFPDTREDIRKFLLNILAKIVPSISQYLDRENDIQSRVIETAKLLDIESQLWKKPKQLSGGQRQRVALGRAIIRNPKAFLMDEPLSNLDAKLRVQMRAELERLTHKLHITTIYVTHDQIEAMTLGNRIVVMNKGLANQVGTPEQVYNYPVNKFVAGFIGTPPMNFTNGFVKSESGTYIFESDAFKIVIPDRYNRGISEYVMKEVSMGIRPEHIEILRQSNNANIQASVGVLEPIGSETYVFLDFPENVELIAKVEGIMKLNIEEVVGINFLSDYIHFFDIESELRILPDGGLDQTHYDREI